MKVLIVGWFSFDKCNATAGDLMAKDIICDWLESIDCEYDVSTVPPYSGGIDWRLAEPSNYSHVVFVCGPFPYDENTTSFLERFKECTLIGIDLSMIERLDEWNPFDILFERDSSESSRPDITFLSRHKKVPVVGIILVHPQHEYKEKSRHDVANSAIDRLMQSKEAAFIPIDTCLDPNTTNLRNSSEVESLIARMDFVITTRLHGTVLALKNGVPALVIDAISGGAKVTKQIKEIKWDVAFSVDDINDKALQDAFDYCLTDSAREKAMQCKQKACIELQQLHKSFTEALSKPVKKSQRTPASKKIVDEFEKKQINESLYRLIYTPPNLLKMLAKKAIKSALG